MCCSIVWLQSLSVSYYTGSGLLFIKFEGTLQSVKSLIALVRHPIKRSLKSVAEAVSARIWSLTLRWTSDWVMLFDWAWFKDVFSLLMRRPTERLCPSSGNLVLFWFWISTHIYLKSIVSCQVFPQLVASTCWSEHSSHCFSTITTSSSRYWFSRSGNRRSSAFSWRRSWFLEFIPRWTEH